MAHDVSTPIRVLQVAGALLFVISLATGGHAYFWRFDAVAARGDLTVGPVRDRRRAVLRVRTAPQRAGTHATETGTACTCRHRGRTCGVRHRGERAVPGLHAPVGAAAGHVVRAVGMGVVGRRRRAGRRRRRHAARRPHFEPEGTDGTRSVAPGVPARRGRNRWKRVACTASCVTPSTSDGCSLSEARR